MSVAAYRFNNDLRYRSADHPAQTQFTPSYVLEPVRAALGGEIGLDPCTTPDNPTGARLFYTPPRDGLALPWAVDGVFVNPPYGKAREPWARRCMAEGETGRRVVLLVPSHTDTRILQAVLATSTEAVLIRGRVKFGTLRPNRRQVAASHPSILIGWNIDLAECAGLGLRIRPVSP